MFADVVVMFGQLGLQEFDDRLYHLAKLLRPMHGVDSQLEAVHIIQHHHVEGRGSCALLFVAAHMEVVVVMAAVAQAMNEPRIAMISKDDRLTGGKDSVKRLVAQPMRMLASRL